jgi:thiol-disulfide isomerase/thioredoxin
MQQLLHFKSIVIIGLSILYCLSLSTNLNAQSYKVDITMTNYQSDTLIVGYYYAERQLVRDTLISDNQKNFVWEGDDALHTGVYILLTAPDKNFIQFFVNDHYPKFSIKSNGDMSDISFKNSPDNVSFNEYVHFVSKMKAEIEPIRQQYETATEEEKVRLNALMDVQDQEVRKKQEEMMASAPESFTAKTIKSTLPIDYPDPPAGLEGRDLEFYQFGQYREHYFDHVDLSDSTLIYTPFLDTRIEYYIDKLTVQLPDSINASLDYILGQMDPDSQMFRYYLSKLYNKYIQSKMVGMDAVVVHLSDNYYGKGLAKWADEETLEKILDNANKSRPSLIGKTAKDIQVELQDGTPIKISDIDYEYLVLLFWAPDCGHCKKAMPDVIEFEEAFRSENVKIMSVCTKYQEKVPKCWESIEEKGMQNFINTADPLGKSRFKSYFDIRTTPKIFILNKDRQIIIKGIGANQLSDVMTDIIKRGKAEN